MLLTRLLCACAVLIVAARVPAQTQNSAGSRAPRPSSGISADGAGRKLIDQHLRFIQEMYKLDAAQITKCRSEFTQLLPAQRQYELETATTLRRLPLARVVVLDDKNADEATRLRKAKGFEREYHRLITRAPLSTANVLRRVEAMLPPGQVAQGHARIKAKFAGRLARKGASAPIDYDAIGAILAGPMPRAQIPEMIKPTGRPGDEPVARSPAPAPAPPAARRGDEESPPRPTVPRRQPKTAPPPATASGEAGTRSASATQDPPARTSSSATRTPQISAKRPAPRSAAKTPPKPLAPAPPESEWSKQFDATTGGYGFTAVQMIAAKSVLNGCLARAALHRKQQKSDYQDAEKIADGADKAAKLNRLNRRLDELYDEMIQRVDSLATIDQKQQAGKGKGTQTPAPPAAPAKPTQRTPETQAKPNKSAGDETPKKAAPAKAPPKKATP